MAASHTLSHPPAIPQISKLGVLTLCDYGIRITMQAGHLQIEDGITEDRYKFRLPRVNHRVKRLVCIGDDGFIQCQESINRDINRMCSKVSRSRLSWDSPSQLLQTRFRGRY